MRIMRARVAESEVFGGVCVGFLRSVGVGVVFFYPTPTHEVQLNHYIRRAPRLGFLTRAC